MTDAATGTAVAHRRRWPYALAAVALLLAFSYWATRPVRVAAVVLSRVEAALGLEITASGRSEYRLRGAPTLVLRDVVVRQPGADAPLLRAERILLSLPWSTLRGAGETLVVRRVELDAPRLDLAAYQAWQATRPAAPARLPTLTDGLQVGNGRIVGGSWSIDGVNVDVPAFHPDRAAAGVVSGRYRAARVAVPFALHAALTRPARNAGLRLAGGVEVQADGWRLPMSVTASGRLHDGADGLGLDGLRYAADARYVGGDVEDAFALGLAGQVRYRDGRLTVSPLGVALDGGGRLLPDLHAGGRLALDDALALWLDGALARWPQAWPALPAPLGSSNAPLPFALRYAGAPDLSGTTGLSLARDGTAFDGRFRIPDVLAWLERPAGDTPLPPLRGHLSSPQLEIGGAHLLGVEIEFEDDAAVDAGP